METNRYLLPNYFKKIGWITSIPSAIVLIAYLFMNTSRMEMQGVFDELYQALTTTTFVAIFMVVLMAGLLFIAFAKEKIEDEYITKLRGDSLIWAVIANAILIAVLSVLVYGLDFLYVAFSNLYLVLVLFIIKFNIALRCLKKEIRYEK